LFIGDTYSKTALLRAANTRLFLADGLIGNKSQVSEIKGIGKEEKIKMSPLQKEGNSTLVRKLVPHTLVNYKIF